MQNPELSNVRLRSWTDPMKPIDWDIRRERRRWSHEEFDQPIYEAPEKID